MLPLTPLSVKEEGRELMLNLGFPEEPRESLLIPEGEDRSAFYSGFPKQKGISAVPEPYFRINQGTRRTDYTFLRLDGIEAFLLIKKGPGEVFG